MARPIWTGTLSFGLLHVPVSLMAGERRTESHFRMLDGRDRSPIRYLRVNSETGDEVPWKEIVKAYEYEKGQYVVLDPEDLEAAAPERHESIEVEAFVDASSLGVRHYRKPYVILPGKKAEKGYVLLRETLARTEKIGIGRVVIRTREHLAAVMPEGGALVTMLLRYPEELVDPDDFALPRGELSRYRISPKELEMASELVESMTAPWDPPAFRDEYEERLGELVATRLEEKGARTTVEPPARRREEAATNVVDFMALLERSLESTKPERRPRTKKGDSEKRPAAKRKGPAKARPKKAASRKKTG